MLLYKANVIRAWQTDNLVESHKRIKYNTVMKRMVFHIILKSAFVYDMNIFSFFYLYSFFAFITCLFLIKVNDIRDNLQLLLA